MREIQKKQEETKRNTSITKTGKKIQSSPILIFANPRGEKATIFINLLLIYLPNLIFNKSKKDTEKSKKQEKIQSSHSDFCKPERGEGFNLYHSFPELFAQLYLQ